MIGKQLKQLLESFLGRREVNLCNLSEITISFLISINWTKVVLFSY